MQRADAVNEEQAPSTTATDATTATLAGELKRQRKLKGMSLDELASASGVSRAMISKIERGQSSPSTSILSKLVDALDTTVARLLGQEAAPQDIVLMRAAQQVVLVDTQTGFSRRVLSPILPGRGLDFVMAEMPPKSDTGPLVAHSMPVEEYVYVLSGSLTVTVGNTRAVLNAADAMYYRADVPHRFENDGRTICKYLIVINPVRG
jgi:transcriptional regulator with XRE-family HTH domain